MTFHSLCPCGLKSFLRCIIRATVLSQPTDVPNFVAKYLSEVISYRNLQSEEDPRIVFFNFQQLWENKLLKCIMPTSSQVTSIIAEVLSPVKPQRHPTVPAQTKKRPPTPVKPLKGPTVPEPTKKRPATPVKPLKGPTVPEPTKKRPPTPVKPLKGPTVPAPTVTHTCDLPPIAAKKKPPTPVKPLKCPTVPEPTKKKPPTPIKPLKGPTVPEPTKKKPPTPIKPLKGPTVPEPTKKKPPTPIKPLKGPTVPEPTKKKPPTPIKPLKGPTVPEPTKKRSPTPVKPLKGPTVPAPKVTHNSDLPPIAAKKKLPTPVKPLKCPTVPALTKKRPPTPVKPLKCPAVPELTVTHTRVLPPIAENERPPTPVKPLKCPTVPAPTVTHTRVLPPIAAKKRPPTFLWAAGEETHAPHPSPLRLPKPTVTSHQKGKGTIDNLKKRSGSCQDVTLLKIYAPEDQVGQVPKKKKKWNKRFIFPEKPSITRFPQISSNFNQADMSSPDNRCPHSEHSTHILRYKRVRVSFPYLDPDNGKRERRERRFRSP